MAVSLRDALKKRTHRQIVELEAEVDRLKAQLKNGKPKKKRGLTEQQKREYMKDPDHCPYCESGRLTGSFVDLFSQGAAQPVKCEDCGRTWHDIYELVGVEEDR